MARWIATYLIAFALFGTLDFVWLSTMSARLYAPVLGPLMAPQARLDAALLFYLGYLAGLVWFAVRPGLALGPRAGVLNGALYGACCYLTYDLTNQATLARWATHITVLDILWGSFASATAAGLTSVIAARWLRKS
ncbi:MAG: DUF2177 family protein [Proteobacteria bacterium]|nr:DUF2177 family protein [Pseudomonadota bacterium]